MAGEVEWKRCIKTHGTRMNEKVHKKAWNEKCNVAA